MRMCPDCKAAKDFCLCPIPASGASLSAPKPQDGRTHYDGCHREHADCTERLKAQPTAPPEPTAFQREVAARVFEVYWSAHNMVSIADDSQQDVNREIGIGVIAHALADANVVDGRSRDLSTEILANMSKERAEAVNAKLDITLECVALRVENERLQGLISEVQDHYVVRDHPNEENFDFYERFNSARRALGCDKS